MLALSALLCCAVVEAPAQSGPARDGPTWRTRTPPIIGPPPVAFDPAEVDFGDMRPGSRAERTVIVTNTGDKPVTLGQVQSTCWCAAGALSQSTLGPDESATLTVSLDAGDLLTTVTRRVELIVDGYSQSASLPLRADVHYGVRPRLMLDHGTLRTGTLTLESADEQPFRVLSANGASPEFVDGFDPEKDGPRARYSVRFDLSGVERLPRWFVVETDRLDSPVIDVPVPDWAPERVATAWSIAEPRVMLGTVLGGSRAEVRLTMRGFVGDPLEFIESVRVEPSGLLDAEIVGMRREGDDMLLRLQVSAATPSPALAVCRLVISAGGAEGSTVLMGRVVGGEETERRRDGLTE